MGGILLQPKEQFIPRSGQTEMALVVANAIDDGHALVVEARTGVDETFSYRVPALMSGKRILLSTATKVLQDLLFGRALPHLIEALELPVRAALLKGRASYLCMRRIKMACQENSLLKGIPVSFLARIEQWSQVKRTGDLAELADLDERSPIRPFISSTYDSCLGWQCPRFRARHVNQARREAVAAKVAIVNHRLFLLTLRFATRT